MKKHVVLIIILITLFILFLFFYLRAHDYDLEYDIDDIKVTEKYHKDDKYYEFVFNYDDKDYHVISRKKYTTKRKLISDINIEEQDDGVCLSFESNYISLYPICSNDDEYFSPYVDKQDNFKETKSYENIKISNLKNHTFLLWDYRNFIYLSPKKQTKISLFDKDIYNLNLTYELDNYLLVPNYNEDYKFTKLYMINTNNAKVKDMDLRYEVYFESYFLGHEKKKVYLYDIKNEQELYFDLKKDEIYKTDYKILDNGKWKKVTNQKLKNNKLSFETYELYTYTLKDNTLYANTPKQTIKLSNRDVSKIVKYNDKEVYYISKDTLYYFNLYSGEEALLKYSEWEFNNDNMIYIF